MVTMIFQASYGTVVHLQGMSLGGCYYICQANEQMEATSEHGHCDLSSNGFYVLLSQLGKVVATTRLVSEGCLLLAWPVS